MLLLYVNDAIASGADVLHKQMDALHEWYFQWPMKVDIERIVLNKSVCI